MKWKTLPVWKIFLFLKEYKGGIDMIPSLNKNQSEQLSKIMENLAGLEPKKFDTIIVLLSEICEKLDVLIDCTDTIKNVIPDA